MDKANIWPVIFLFGRCVRSGTSYTYYFYSAEKTTTLTALIMKLIKSMSSFIVIPLHVWTYSGTRCRASQDHGATWIQIYNTK